ncbi:putative two-component system response regulator [Marinitoga hydrogenitolerans DSM 16785]|uniref:Two-component system response regulator n=1 Tax=Marinitoga hydrogenitolerans (strain DSM 16785 / JCM 12826 / AT1271) TaxID=1122195 RepID=A0A1M4UJW0_MARH1|nr:HD domain-containing phosphohydrolase [Marinitoga hydrogenitolerans]SHE56945.1 putative two-component system response regulator [Marinitoga hydrogenitolerans DSM 16785]
MIISEYIRELNYEPIIASNGKEALKILKKEAVSVILMDIYMPVMGGFETIKKIRDMNIPTPIIILTTATNESDLKQAAKNGADDFLIKPVNFDELKIRLNTILKVKIFYENKNQFFASLLNENIVALENLENLYKKNQNLVFELLEKMYLVSEFRDDETYEHTKRVGSLSKLIAQAMNLDSNLINEIYFAAPLHDIGKIGIRDNILLKPGKLTIEEYEVMKDHAAIGYKILSKSESSILKLAASIAITHHERWDGSGYPRGLKRNEIPIEGLIVGVVDSFDAIVSKRIYKDKRELKEGFDEIKRLSGIMYSPKVVETLFKIKDKIKTFYEGGKLN